MQQAKSSSLETQSSDGKTPISEMRSCSYCSIRLDISRSQWSATDVGQELTSSARYCGSWPCNISCTRTASLKSMRCRIDNKCSSRRTGVICSHLPVLVISWAAAFWTDWSFCSRYNIRLTDDHWLCCNSNKDTTNERLTPWLTGDPA